MTPPHACGGGGNPHLATPISLIRVSRSSEFTPKNMGTISEPVSFQTLAPRLPLSPADDGRVKDPVPSVCNRRATVPPEKGMASSTMPMTTTVPMWRAQGRDVLSFIDSIGSIFLMLFYVENDHNKRGLFSSFAMLNSC